MNESRTLLIAPGLYLASGTLPFRINCYIADDMLIDTRTRLSMPLLRRQIAGSAISLVALTHCHPDHQGCAAAICAERNVPLACHEADADAAEGKVPMEPSYALSRWIVPVLRGPVCTVLRRLRDGEKLGDWRVVHAPGHTPGHCFYYREKDGIVISGDVAANINFVTGRECLHFPPPFFSWNSRANAQALRKLLDLEPKLVLFGHGHPLTDIGKLKRLLER